MDRMVLISLALCLSYGLMFLIFKKKVETGIVCFFRREKKMETGIVVAMVIRN